ncbi:MAG: FeoB-associated Cys-rich membrane protein [Clostridia bacterium]|nr:FeoB-associated Cys-rich membrane protein [Clostridia bacterium]
MTNLILSTLNIPTILVIVAVTVCVLTAIVFMIISRRKGKSCSGCSSCSAKCPYRKEEKEKK